MKKAIALTLAAAMSASLLAGCGGSQNGGSQTAEGAESSLPAYNELTVGTDYTDLKADLKFITHRTDLVDDGTFAGYVAEFQKMYPNTRVPTSASSAANRPTAFPLSTWVAARMPSTGILNRKRSSSSTRQGSPSCRPTPTTPAWSR